MQRGCLLTDESSPRRIMYIGDDNTCVFRAEIISFFHYRKVRSKGYVREAYYQEPDYHKRSCSDAELISKIEGGLQEFEETVFWLELPVDSDIIKAEQMAELMKEADELIAILVYISTTVKIRKNRK